MRILTAALLGTALLQAQTAEDWLRRVPPAYKNLDKYHIAWTSDGSLKGELHQSQTRSLTEVAYAGPRKVRFESRQSHSWVLLVADGEALWRANRNTREYLRTPLEGPVADVKGGGPVADMAVHMWKLSHQQYERAARDIKRARIRGEEMVDVAGVEYRSIVVEAEYNPPPLAPGIEFASRTYWIDKDLHLVLREESITRGKLSPMQPYEQQESRHSTRVTRLDLGTPAEALFVFDPSAEQVEVSSLDYPRPGGSESAKLIGKPAPEIMAKTLDGEPWKLSEQRGKPVLLDFWATWCSPCRDQMPKLAKLHNEWKDKGLLLIGVNDDADPGTAQKYLAEHRHVWLNIFDGVDKKVRTAFKVHGIPTLVLIDAAGNVVEYQVGSGESSEGRIRTSLEKLLP